MNDKESPSLEKCRLLQQRRYSSLVWALALACQRTAVVASSLSREIFFATVFRICCCESAEFQFLCDDSIGALLFFCPISSFVAALLARQIEID